jgi:putative hemolysin
MKEILPALGLVAVLIALVVSACGPSQVQPTPAPAEGETGLPNPASVYCEEQGYQVEIRTAEDGSQNGVCVFPHGSECGEWEFYRGDCGPDSQAPRASAGDDQG